MKIRRRIVFAALLSFSVGLVSLVASAQDTPTIYAESFRKGATQVTEASFDVKLTPQEPTYHEVIKDSHGADRYDLTVIPEGPEGDTRLTAWRVKLRDLHHSIYSNILLANQEPSQDPKNNLWWLTPNPFAAVPILSRRIVKVDSFYLLMQVKDLHFSPLDSPYVDRMTVRFAFTNTDPRAAK